MASMYVLLISIPGLVFEHKSSFSNLDQAHSSQVTDQRAVLVGNISTDSDVEPLTPQSNDQPTSPTGTSVSTPPISRRPALGRSVSSPMNIAARHASRRLTSGFINSLPHSRPEVPQWSIFGQMMGNEAQYDSRREDASNMSTIHHARESHEPRPSIGISTQNDVSGISSTSSFLSPLARTQSPVSGEAGSFLSYHELNDGNNSETSSSSGREQDCPPSSSSSILEWLPSLPVLYRNILKCAIAYFIGSLFTFVPYLSGLLSDITSYGPGDHSPYPSGHMVATV
jgi:hypothetical protein